MQPPLSQRIRRLEDRVGHPLFTRGPGRVGLTPAGEELLLPALLHRFRERSPGVQLHVQEMTTAPQLAALRDRGLDVGLLREPDDDPELAFRTVLSEPFVAVLPAGHPLAKRERVPVRQLADSPFILLPRHVGPRLHDQIVGLCAAAGFVPSVAQHAVEWLTVCALVEAGLGVSIAPAGVARLRLPGVAFRPLEAVSVRTRVCLGWHRDRRGPLVDRLLEILDSEIQAQ